MKKILVALCLFFCLSACGEESNKSQANALNNTKKDVIKIGTIYPMSGEYAHFGDAMKVAIKMFEEDEQTKKSDFSYKFFIEDGAFNTSRSAVVAKKLIDIDKVDVLVTLSSDIGSVVSPIAQANKVIHLSLATELNVAKGEYNFTVSTPPNKNVEKMVDELKRLHLNKVVFVVQNTAMMQSVAEYIRDAGRSGEINILSDNTINSGERDFRILIRKMLECKPDAMIVQLQPPELQVFVKQLREIDKNIVITTVETFGYPEDKGLFEGTWFSGAVVPSKQFSEKYKGMTGLDATNYSELFYAVMEVIRKAYTSDDKTQVIKNISSVKMNSFSIGNIFFDTEGVMQTDAYLYTIKNGKVELVGDSE